jgi:glycogen phosphorylase
VTQLRAQGYQPMRLYESNARLRSVLDAIAHGTFSPDEPGRYRPLVDALLWGGDQYQLLADYDAYVQTQSRVDALFRDPHEWAKRAIVNVAGMGVFSSDRTIREYAKEIWAIELRP